MKFMDRLERLEQGIGQAVGFSKGFGTFEKADIANRIRTVMDDESYIDPNEMLMAPNIYAVNFSPADFDRIREWGNPFAIELCDLAISHARAQGYSLIGAVRITFHSLPEVHPGDFQVVPTFEYFSTPPAQGALPVQTPVNDAPPSPHGAPSYSPVRPPRARSLPTRITKPQAAPAQQPPQAPPAPAPQPLVPHLEIDGQPIELTSFPVVIGRGSVADIRVDGKSISRRHLQISHQSGAYIVTDLGSTNGTMLNGTALRAPATLHDGSLLRLGDTSIFFRMMPAGGAL